MEGPKIVVPPEVAAAGPSPPPAPIRPPQKRNRHRTVAVAAIGVIATLVVGAIGFAITQRSGSDDTDDLAVGVLDDSSSTAGGTSTTVPTTTAPTTTAPTTTAPTTTAPTTTAAPVPTTISGPPLRDTGTVRQAVLSDGILYLRGSVPSEDFGAEIARRAAAVVGEGNVVNQYIVDLSAPPVDSAPLYVADTVLFPTGGVDINPAFLPLLDLGTTLLGLNENVTITVVAHTDSAGSSGLNLRLSQARAEVVRQYWLDQGIAPDRVFADGRGEAEPIADNNTEQGKQLNRRAEFIVTGILG
ncbi:MAG: OmpA family protein [Acidimicrobiales bacterium]|nr:OmpA family protein [Acidimicrobiales bacterium]